MVNDVSTVFCPVRCRHMVGDGRGDSLIHSSDDTRGVVKPHSLRKLRVNCEKRGASVRMETNGLERGVGKTVVRLVPALTYISSCLAITLSIATELTFNENGTIVIITVHFARFRKDIVQGRSLNAIADNGKALWQAGTSSFCPVTLCNTLSGMHPEQRTIRNRFRI